MPVVYALYDLANMVGGLGQGIIVLGSNILGVYLIGGFLGLPLIQFGAQVTIAGSRIYNVANAFENVYNEIRNGISLPDGLRQLIEWAGRIIDFVSNPYPYILSHVVQIIYDRFPFLRDIVTSVVNWLSTIIPQFQLFRTSPIQWVIDKLTSIIPSFSIFRSSPVQWVIDKLKIYSAQLSQFIQDPDGYIKAKLYAFFPDLRLFLENPTEYIMMKLADKLEIFAERYLTRLVKIVENILNAIF